MKKKLLILFIPIALSIFGIIYFQIDWMSKTYDLEFKKINTDADYALKMALRRFHLENQDSLTNFLLPKLTPIAERSNLKFSNDSLIINLETEYSLSLDPDANSTIRVSTSSGKIRINYPAYNYHSDRSLYTETDLKVINNSETLQRQVREIISHFSNTCDPIYFESDSLRLAAYFKDNIADMGMADLTDLFQLTFHCQYKVPLEFPMSLGTSLLKYYPKGLEAYSYNNRWVGAYFQSHHGRIMSQIFGRSSLSILLILIMILCFIYLIKIILNQKRIAEAKDNYINNMTHELKTPIATISAAVEGMQSFKVLEDKEKTQRYLNTTRTELSRLGNMVTKILNISIYDRDEIEMVIQQVNLLSLIDDVIDTEKLKADKAIDFNLNIKPNLPAIHVDPTHFRNVLTNLIDNAVKYSNENVEINITCYQERGSVYIKIHDNGIGIPSSHMRRIFDKFYRVPTGNLHNVKGSGLGLYYVKYIIERHGGTISVKSEVNMGSEFVIIIPLK